MAYRIRRSRYRRKPVTRRRLQVTKRSRLPGFSRAPWAKSIYTGAKLGRMAARAWSAKRKYESSSSSSGGQAGVELADYKRSRGKFGRRYSKARTGRKLLKQNQKVMKLCLRNYGPWNNGAGQIPIASMQVGGAGQYTAPVHLYELTGCPQTYDVGGNYGIKYPFTRYELRFSSVGSVGGTVDLQWIGWGASGTPTLVSNMNQDTSSLSKDNHLYPIQLDNVGVDAPGPNEINAHSLPGKKSYIESVSAKLLLYGPQTQPVRWSIQLVQLSEEVTPGYAGTNLRSVAFWQAMAKPFGYSPLESGSLQNMKKRYKVLKSWSYLMDAPESTEDHLTARMRQVDLFFNLNRKANYEWMFNEDQVALAAEDTFESADGRDISTHVHPKARVYLMIRALTPFKTTTFDAVTNPSYDIKLITTHRNLDS